MTHEWMHWEPVKARRFASLRLTPARVVVAAGAGVAVLAGLMPWAEGIAPGRQGFEPVSFSGLAGAGDGVMLIVVSALAGILTIHRSPADSRTRTVRLLPAVLVALAVFTWLNGQRAAAGAVHEWTLRGGHGGPAAGLWLAAGGVAAMAAGTLWLLPGVLRWNHEDGDPERILSFSWSGLAEIVAGIAGVLLGGVLGINLGLALTGPTLVGTIFLGAVLGGLLGAYAGTRLAGAIARRVAGRRRGGEAAERR